MLLLGAGLAQAQSPADCLNDDSYPLAGTAGYANGLQALRINAATYNATAFAEGSLFPTARAALAQDEADAKRAAGEAGTAEEQQEQAQAAAAAGLGTQGAVGPTQRGVFRGWDLAGAVVYEANQYYGVTRVPVWQVGADCPAEYRVADRPLDLTAVNLGAAARYCRLGFFFSSSIVYGNLGESKDQTRVGLSVISTMVATTALALTPFTGRTSVIQGSTSWATDFVAGATADLELVELRAGYTASRGWFLSAGEDRVGLFGNTVAKDDFSRFDQFSLGAKRVKWGKASEKGVGRSTAFARQVPMTEVQTVDAEGQPTTVADPLRTGHVRQEDLFGRLDLAFGYAVKPVPMVHDVAVAWHSRGFNEPVPSGASWRIAGGMVQLPVQHYYGLDGGSYLNLRGEFASPVRVNGQDAGRLSLLVLFNDEEQLAVFPFATNAVSWRANFTVRL